MHQWIGTENAGITLYSLRNSSSVVKNKYINCLLTTHMYNPEEQISESIISKIVTITYLQKKKNKIKNHGRKYNNKSKLYIKNLIRYY